MRRAAILIGPEYGTVSRPDLTAARFIPGVCGVFTSSSSACTTRTPCRRHFDSPFACIWGPRDCLVDEHYGRPRAQ